MMRVAVRWTVLVITAVLAAGVFATPPASAAGYVFNELTVQPQQYCDPDSSTTPCGTDLSFAASPIYTNTASTITVALSDAAGPIVTTTPTQMQYFTQGNYSLRATPSLAAGAYTMTAHVVTPGKWECSPYNPDGCTYMNAQDETLVWRFTYTGGALKVAPSPESTTFEPAATSIFSAKVRKKSERKRLIAAQVVGSERSNGFVAFQPLSGRQVLAQVKVKGRGWKTLKTLVSGADGTIKAAVKVPVGARYKWRLTVLPTATLPGATQVILKKV